MTFSAFPLPQPQSPPSLSESQARMVRALDERRFFKLIGGGSFTEGDKIAQLSNIYSRAGVDCIDIAPDAALIETVWRAVQSVQGPKPVIMVSIPLDADPHFRKIELTEADCIGCGLCLPVCPTEAFTLSSALEVSQNLCYGCGRCVPTCPTDALRLLPFQVESQIEAALKHPATEAVEIHSHFVDAYMLEAFLNRWGHLLHNKLVALCFRLDQPDDPQVLSFVQTAQRRHAMPILLQIDGLPMSGTTHLEASLPALEAAVRARHIFEKNNLQAPPITISGGINQQTACLLQQAPYQWIAGAGMGTVARQAVWNLNEPEALAVATQITQAFQSRSADRRL